MLRGDRGPRGFIDRAGKIQGVNVKGDPAGTVKAWGGGVASVDTPTIGDYPVVTLPIDDDVNLDLLPLGQMDRVDSTARSDRKSTRDTTRARLFTQFMTFVNWIAWLKDCVAGTRSFKGIVVDGVGGEPAAGAPGSISASVLEGGTLTLGGVAQGRIVAAAHINAGTSLASSVGLDAVAPFTHNGTGSYTLKLANAAADTNKLICQATFKLISGFALLSPISSTEILVGTYDASDTATDTSLYVEIRELP